MKIVARTQNLLSSQDEPIQMLHGKIGHTIRVAFLKYALTLQDFTMDYTNMSVFTGVHPLVDRLAKL